MLRAGTVRLAIVAVAVVIALAGAGLVLAAPLGTAFTYQGQLRQAGVPVNGTCDFQFSLFDAAAAGAQIGATQAATGVTLVDGRFTVQLDFGPAAFTGEARWLQIATRCPSGSGGFTPLDPRQPLTPSPYALFSTAATSFTGNLAGDVTGTQGATIVARLQGRNVVNTAPTDGQVLKFNAAQNRWEPSAEVNSLNYLSAFTPLIVFNGVLGDNTFRPTLLNNVAQINGWTVAGDRHSVTPQASGLYLIHYASSMFTTSRPAIVEFRFARDGTAITGSEAILQLPVPVERRNVAASFLAQLTVGSIVTCEVSSDDLAFFQYLYVTITRVS
jgi:hypothetical protein